MFESIMEECDTQRYFNAYTKSIKVLEQAQLSVERWEQLVRIEKRIFRRQSGSLMNKEPLSMMLPANWRLRSQKRLSK